MSSEKNKCNIIKPSELKELLRPYPPNEICRQKISLNEDLFTWCVTNYVAGTLKSPIFEINGSQWQIRIRPQLPENFAPHSTTQMEYMVKSWNKRRISARFELEVAHPKVRNRHVVIFSSNYVHDFNYEEETDKRVRPFKDVPYMRKGFVLSFRLYETS